MRAKWEILPNNSGSGIIWIMKCDRARTMRPYDGLPPQTVVAGPLWSMANELWAICAYICSIQFRWMLEPGLAQKKLVLQEESIVQKW